MPKGRIILLMDKNDPRREPSEEELDELNEHWHEPGDPDDVVADDEQKLEAERQRQRQASAAQPLPQRYHPKRRWPRVLLVIVLIAVAAAGAYWFGNHQASSPQPKATQQASDKPTPPTAQPTKHYDSTTYTLGFDYPATWKVSDTAARLSVTSPAMQLPTAGGKQTSGHIIITIRNKQPSLPEFSTGNATAALESQKLTYKQPTQIQRAQTYLSFLTYASSSAGSLDALYVTGDNGYQAGQAIPMGDIILSDPLIGVSFASCPSDDCTTGTPTPLSLTASAWKNNTISQPIIALLQSLTLN